MNFEIWLIIDEENDVVCAAFTKEEAEEIMREDEDPLRIRITYLYAEHLIAAKKELETLLLNINEVEKAYPGLSALNKLLSE